MKSKGKTDRIIAEPLEGKRGCMKYTNPDWGTIAYYIPKSSFALNNNFAEAELKYNCIYFLVGYECDINNNMIEMMYVGKAGIRADGESVIKRTREHLTNTNESYYGKWDHIIILTNEKEDWGATEIAALEYIFWSLIPKGNRYNSQLPSSNGADLSLYADMITQIKAYINKMQFQMFIKDTEKETKEQVKEIAAAKSDIPIDLNTGTLTVPDITTPKWVVKQMINLLPQELFDNTNTIFLDPACKAGEYLEEIFNRCMESEKHKQHFKNFSNPELAQAMHILTKQLYGIALTPNSLKIASLKMQGSPNIISISNYIDRIKSGSLIKLINEEFGKSMKFDVVIGNPPYNDNEASISTAIYSEFLLKLKEHSRYISFITPARWYSSGRGLTKLRGTLLNEKHLSTLVDFPNSGDIFNNVRITGGVCYYLYDNNYIGNCNVKQSVNKKIIYNDIRDLSKYPIFVRDSIGLNIIDKVMQVNNGNYVFSDVGVQSVDCFNVKDNIAVHGYYREGDTKIVDSTGYLYANRDYLNNQHLIDCYNVIVTHAIGGEGYVIPKTVRILDKGEACSVTYLCIGATQSKEKAENLLKYIKSKFVRFLILQTLSGQNISASNFMFVPVFQFDESDGIDWLGGISNIDQQLYKKYNLSSDEVAYIEAKIKPMESFTKEDVAAAYINQQLTNQP